MSAPPTPLLLLPTDPAALAELLQHPIVQGAMQQIVQAAVQAALAADRARREQEQGRSTVAELAQLLGVSLSTIERRIRDVPALSALPVDTSGARGERRFNTQDFCRLWGRRKDRIGT